MDELNRINEIVKTTNTTDFRVQSYNGTNLLITGSFDFAYYHELEVEFLSVSYISLPVLFNYPNIRKATTSEAEAIRKIVAAISDDIVFCIEAESDGSFERLQFYVVAKSLIIREGTVYYYERENLKENERIADWVKRSR